MTTTETLIDIEAVRVPPMRDGYGNLFELGHNIQSEGLRSPITVWTDGTLISGSRRLRAYFLMSGSSGGHKYRRIPAVFVHTIEDAAKRLHADNQDSHHAMPMGWVEVCRLWETIMKLDAPAAALRADAARRRGVELRKATTAGRRKPGRTNPTSENYVLGVLGQTVGVSEMTTSRIWRIYTLANSDDGRRDQAAQALKDIDAGNTSIWAEYSRLAARKPAPPSSRPRLAKVVEPKAAAQQQAAWSKALPRLEGMVTGLAELGPPNPDLTQDQVRVVHARLVAVRRDLEKMINQMKGFKTS